MKIIARVRDAALRRTIGEAADAIDAEVGDEPLELNGGEGYNTAADVVIVEPIDPHEPVIDVAAVRLVSEIVSPGNPAGDRVLKAELGRVERLAAEAEPGENRANRRGGASIDRVPQ